MHLNIMILLFISYSSMVGAQSHPRMSNGVDRVPIAVMGILDTELAIPTINLSDLNINLPEISPENYVTDLSGEDAAAGNCPVCTIAGTSSNQINNLDSLAIKDCSCRGFDSESDDRRVRAVGLEKVCQCYFSQKNTFFPPTAAQSDFDYGISAGVTRAANQKILNSLSATLFNGHVGQAISLGLNMPQSNPASNKSPKLSSVISAGAGLDVISGATGSVSVYNVVSTGSTSNPPAPGKATEISKQVGSLVGNSITHGGSTEEALALVKRRSVDSPELLSGDNCVSPKQYMEFKETPSKEYGGESPFYSFLATSRNAPFDISQWRLSSLLEKYKASVDEFIEAKKENLESDPLISQYKERIKFLLSNPLYSKLFEAPNAIEFQQKLAQNIIKNFYPPNCKLHPASDCAFKASAVADRRKDDKALFDNSMVRDIIKNQPISIVQNILGPYINKPDSFAVPQYSELTQKLLSLSPSEMGKDSRSKIIGLCNMARFGKTMFKPKTSPPSKGYFSEGDYRVEDILIEAGKEDMEGSGSGYEKFVKDICQTPRCKPIKVGQNDQCNGDSLTFAKFYENYSRQHNCAVKGLGCWQEAQKSYFKDYPLVSEANFGVSNGVGLAYNSFIGGEKASSTKDQANMVLQYQATEAAGPSTTVSFASTSSPSGEPIYSITSSPTFDKFYKSGPGSLSLADAISGPRNSVPSSIVPATSGANLAAEPSRNSDPSNLSSSNPAANRSNYMPYVSLPAPTAAEIPQITADAQLARSESNKLESQANALASLRSTATDQTVKSSLDAQLAALTDRANAADARATSLEAQLRTAERASRSPASTASAPSSSGSTDASTSSSTSNARTAVASGVANSVTVPQGQPQIQGSQQGFQNFGSGTSSVNIPISAGATASGSAKRSNATNFSFKYGSDAAIQAAAGNSPSIIVAGESNSFDATRDFAAAVAQSKSVDLGSQISEKESDLLTNKDMKTISKYMAKYGNSIPPGTIVRLNYASPGQPAQELLVAKDDKGHLFFPAVRRLAQMRAALTVSSSK
jgi:hypothetical protein